jgi:glucokinase
MDKYMKNYMGVDVGCTKIYMCIKVNNVYIEKRAATGLNCSKEKIKKEINDFIKTLPFTPDGVGMALPGLVEGNRSVKFSDINSLNGVNTDFFSDGRFKVKFINDVKAATLAEVANYKDNDTIAVIMSGSGIATGVYSKGQMFNGANNFAGELGYCIINTEDGPRTVDSLSGGMGILKMAGCSIDEFLNKIESNDSDSLALLEQSGYYFGLVLTNMMHLFNPDIIVVGGSTSTYKGYMEKAVETAEKYTLPDIYNSCKILKPKDPKRIVALGAMELVKK